MEDLQRFLDGHETVLLEVTFYLPDHASLLNTFTWQFMDKPPQYARIKRFLDHWRREIETPIQSVRISSSAIISPTRSRFVDAEFLLN